MNCVVIARAEQVVKQARTVQCWQLTQTYLIPLGLLLG
jgi:hypothetical protein